MVTDSRPELVDFRVQADANDVSLWIAYNGRLFDDKRFLERFISISQQLIKNEPENIKQLSVLDDNKLSKLIHHSQTVAVQSSITNLPLVHQMISSPLIPRVGPL